jgi:hypothetical protein
MVESNGFPARPRFAHHLLELADCVVQHRDRLLDRDVFAGHEFSRRARPTRQSSEEAHHSESERTPNHALPSRSLERHWGAASRFGRERAVGERDVYDVLRRRPAAGSELGAVGASR